MVIDHTVVLLYPFCVLLQVCTLENVGGIMGRKIVLRFDFQGGVEFYAQHRLFCVSDETRAGRAVPPPSILHTAAGGAFRILFVGNTF